MSQLPNRKHGDCWEWARNGQCKFGKGCKFKHGNRSATSPPPSKRIKHGNRRATSPPHRKRPNRSLATRISQDSSTRPWHNQGNKPFQSKDTVRFVKHLSSLQPLHISKHLETSGDLWKSAWQDYKSYDAKTLRCLIEALAKIPASSGIDPPPASLCRDAASRLVDISAKDSSDKILTVVEILQNAVTRLMQFEYDECRDDVRTSLIAILIKAEGSLKKADKDHRLIGVRLMKSVDDLDRPWSIKEKRVTTKLPSSESAVEQEPTYELWQTATIGWLSTSQFFTPAQLPVMKTPDSRSCGVYEDKEDYISTINRLWVAMTFADGHAALSPTCRTKSGGNAVGCQQTLWPISSNSTSFNKECRSKHCHNLGEFSCRMKNHDALCSGCANSAQLNIRGAPGPKASTHIYDGEVSRIDTDGRLFITQFKSRNPPQHNIHWRSTKRLSSPNLVGIVKINSDGSSLRDDDAIHWGEIAFHGNPRDEGDRRTAGDLAVKMTSIVEFDYEYFNVGDYVAIIDCMTFVPEWLPVLHAMEKQKSLPLPFEEGRLLNLYQDYPTDTLSPVVDWSKTSNLDAPTLIKNLIQESTLEPICAIRQNRDLANNVKGQLLQLVQEATLDKMQLIAFFDSLLNPVHLTQGPPGTGKSYLGVVIVRALMILRTAWIMQTPSIGTPPILILSYKNHAIDEFLVDLVAAEPARNLRNKLIRIGGQCNDSRLMPYSERAACRADGTVVRLRNLVEDLHKVRVSVKHIGSLIAMFQSYRVDMFSADSNAIGDNDMKQRNLASYEATEILLATLIRAKLLKDALEEQTESQKFLHSFDFLVDGNTKGRKILSVLSDDEIKRSIIENLNNGIKHYNLTNPGDIIYEWIRGLTPLPLCRYTSDFNGKTCDMISNSPHPALCVKHHCRYSDSSSGRCEMHVKGRKKYFCHRHACLSDECEDHKVNDDTQYYCKHHICRKCLELGLVSNLALDDPPRNVCELHPLCCNHSCLNECLPQCDYCQEHEEMLCKAITKKGNPCKNKPISRSLPYCRDHVHKFEIEEVESDDESEDLSNTVNNAPTQCVATTKKGHPCKGFAMHNSKYCYDHAPQEDIIFSKMKKDKSRSTKGIARFDDTKTDTMSKVEDTNVSNNKVAVLPIVEAQEGHKSSSSEGKIEMTTQGQDDVSLSSCSETDKVLDAFDAEKTESPLDDLSIQEEAENIKHLRDVFEVAGFDDNSDTSSISDTDNAAFEDSPHHRHIEGDSTGSDTLSHLEPAQWNWEMSIDERWERCQQLMDSQKSMLSQVMGKIKEEITQARKELQSAKVRANAKMYENRTVIGGTMVGCIARLEAIRSTKPFAVLVEEASEVLEPLLFSCLCNSTCKLEMIGDHLQLQPQVMNKFEFELVNKVNISMFQRLIQAPTEHHVPSTVLSIQRRMRKEICDLTRDYYRDITTIEDHPTTLSQKIGSREGLSTSLINTTATKGREIPGIVPHIYLWTHIGKQERARVGLSRVNKTEAVMICSLAAYLVKCGVPKKSIAILTPYKGQLMLIREKLLKDYKTDQLLSKNPDETNVCRISTVDRFQGDESDIVLISLVVDKDSRTPFVKLANRMIVLLSRARLGMFIVGNVGYFQNNSPAHWAKLLKMLEGSGEVDSSVTQPTELLNDDSRTSNSIKICCPVHRDNTLSVENPKQLHLGFCDVVCKMALSCGHECGLPCHWPSEKHNVRCSIIMPSPCNIHTSQITCDNLFKNSISSKNALHNVASSNYQCPKSVHMVLNCGHEQNMCCWKEKEIRVGKGVTPLCKRKSQTPYVYPICKHTLEVTCSDYSRFDVNPNLVPPCKETVDFIPPICGHEVKLSCNVAQRFRDGSLIYKCPQNVMDSLPRCGHKKNIPCPVSVTLQNWTGERCIEVGKVLESIDYGPKDFICKDLVTYIRNCGHESQETCERAFDIQKSRVPCKRKVETRSRYCGHKCKVLCCEELKIADLPIPDAIKEWKEGQIPPFPRMLPNVRCKENVLLERTCGHKFPVGCCQVVGSLPECKEEATLKSPLCNHIVTVSCNMLKTCQVQVWSTADTLDAINKTGKIEKSAILLQVPDNAKKILNTCQENITCVQQCGHDVQLPCSKVIESMTDEVSTCSVRVQKRLKECGHFIETDCWQFSQYEAGSAKISCDTEVLRDCWNIKQCKNRLPTRCGISGKVACGWPTKWTCENGHSYTINQCTNGVPSSCPGCADALIEQVIDSIPPVNVELNCCLKDVPTGQITCLPYNIAKFCRAEKKILVNFNDYQHSISSLWEREQSHLQHLPIFKILTKKMKHVSEFSPKLFRKINTMQGILTKILNECNMATLENRLSTEADTLTILVGVASVLRVSVEKKLDLNNMKKNKRNKMLQTKLKLGFDSMEFRDKGSHNLIIWDPYPLIATHRVTLTKANIKCIAAHLSENAQYSLLPVPITLKKPKGKLIRVHDLIEKREEVDECALYDRVQINTLLSGSEFEGLNAQELSSGDPLGFGDILSEKVKSNLIEKMTFTNPNASPFQGIKLLETLSASDLDHPNFSLFLALEISGHDTTSAKKYLLSYLDKIRQSIDLSYHPLALICSSRIDGGTEDPIKAFLNICPEATQYLTEIELEVMDTSDGLKHLSQQQRDETNEVLTLWQNLKESYPQNTDSDAMERLLSLTGLSKVKKAAVHIFGSSLQLKKMSQKARAANVMTANYCFLGNPGTGKTTVARLFAEILYDCSLRQKRTIKETTAQKAKDNGMDEFRKEIQGAMGGVLFIDEAYDLDPIGDYKGRPVTNELLTLCENERENISVILAGYEDEFNNKFFAYNDGLKSRFEEIIFEDFEEEELANIWLSMREKKMWEEEENVSSVVVQRLVKAAGRKGFGNARAVRKKLDASIQVAMTRIGDGLSDDNMVLQVRDVIGENPSENVQITKLMKEVELKIGWGKVKSSFHELIQLCSTNYVREMNGDPPIDAFLNRMFIGNPGTGKTTCAKIFGRLLKHLGFLSNGEVVVKTSSDFVGSVIGESQKKSNSIIDGAKGKVLIIDEAYALDDDMYGKQVLNTIVEKVHGTPSDDIAVLLLGYEDQMLSMIRNQNPGLARRFPKDYAFYFDDYNDQELDSILKLNLKQKNLSATVEFQSRALDILRSKRQQSNFGNAGAVEILLNAALQKASQRSNSSRLEEGDIEDPGTMKAAKEADPLDKLDKLFKMENIREKISKLRDSFEVSNREGEDRPELGHFVFTGAPGTGKTTVARIMATILYSLDLISTNKMVETSGLELTGEFLGQTKTKVTETLREAKGGILFVDEAYTLGFGQYGKEACDTLVAAMTSEEYTDLIIIIAGYEADIDKMLDGNAGLKSRFTQFFDFTNWGVVDCINFLKMKANSKNITLEDNTFPFLSDNLGKIIILDGWGNGRDVIWLWNAALKNRASRVVKAPEIERKVTVQDMSKALNELFLARQPKGGKLMGSGNICGEFPIRTTALETYAPNTRSDEAVFTNATTEEQEGECEQSNVEEGQQRPKENFDNERDNGVSDEDWEELNIAKLMNKQSVQKMNNEHIEYLRRKQERKEEDILAVKEFEEEIEKIRIEMEESDRVEAERKVRERDEKRKERARLEQKILEEQEQQRLEKIRKDEIIKQKLQQMMPCPAGFNWFRVGRGWRCGGGSHFVSDTELQRNFTF